MRRPIVRLSYLYSSLAFISVSFIKLKILSRIKSSDTDAKSQDLAIRFKPVIKLFTISPVFRFDSHIGLGNIFLQGEGFIKVGCLFDFIPLGSFYISLLPGLLSFREIHVDPLHQLIKALLSPTRCL